jgi:hypothetical protein
MDLYHPRPYYHENVIMDAPHYYMIIDNNQTTNQMYRRLWMNESIERRLNMATEMNLVLYDSLLYGNHGFGSQQMLERQNSENTITTVPTTGTGSDEDTDNNANEQYDEEYDDWDEDQDEDEIEFVFDLH